MKDRLSDFGDTAAGSEIAVIYYAGHGLQYEGENHLLPVDVGMKRRSDLRRTVLESWLVEEVSQARRLGLVILDACRDNPLAENLKRSLGTTRSASVTRGLARVKETPGNTMVAYATASGDVAEDGRGRNSPFAKALLTHLETPGLEVSLLLRRVRDSVLEATAGAQRPYTYGSLGGSAIYFKAAETAEPTEAPASQPSDAKAAFELAAHIGTVEAYQAIVDSYPGSVYARLAEAAIAKLQANEGPQTAALPPPGMNTSEPNVSIEEAGVPHRVLARSGLRIRSRPTSNSEALGILRHLEVVLVTKEVDARWVKIAFRERHEGYVARRFLRRVAKVKEVAQEPSGPITTQPSAPSSFQTQVAVGSFPREPGSVFRDCPNCPEMVVIPASEFATGAVEPEVEGGYGPLRGVRVGSFALGRYEVTFAEYDYCAEDGGCARRPYDNGWGRGTRPVINVGRDDAKNYANWLSGKTGKRYRLPSATEWEAAARAGDQSPDFFRRAIRQDEANYEGIDPRKTALVGSYPANAFRLHDMHRNVQEWVEDCIWGWGPVPNPPTDGSAWITGGDCKGGYLMGASWRFGLKSLVQPLVAPGIRVHSYDRDSRTGFRVARTLDR